MAAYAVEKKKEIGATWLEKTLLPKISTPIMHPSVNPTIFNKSPWAVKDGPIVKNWQRDTLFIYIYYRLYNNAKLVENLQVYDESMHVTMLILLITNYTTTITISNLPRINTVSCKVICNVLQISNCLIVISAKKYKLSTSFLLPIMLCANYRSNFH